MLPGTYSLKPANMSTTTPLLVLFVLLAVVLGHHQQVLADYNPSNKCPPIDGPDSLYFPDPNCTLFWQCSNGVAYRHMCPASLHFNPTLNVCDYPYRAGCDAPATTETITTTEESTPTIVTSTTQKVPDGSTPWCNPTPTKCTCTCEAVPEDETSTSVWTTKASTTTLSSTTPSDRGDSCEKLSSQCPAVDGQDSVYLPLDDCSAFCQCSNGQAYYQPCPEGLHFNPQLNVCDWPQNAGCSNESNGSTPSAISTPSPSPTTPSVRDSCEKLSSQCPAVDGQHSVYIPLANCSAFCQCSNGQAYYHPCPDGLHFNPTLNVCDWPEQAGCSAGA